MYRGGINMGYESLEKDSLITVRYALNLAVKRLKSIGEGNQQICKDMSYELGRVERMLME